MPLLFSIPSQLEVLRILELIQSKGGQTMKTRIHLSNYYRT